MRKLKSLLFILALALAFAFPVSAGNVPIGYCDSEACVASRPVAANQFWQQEGESYYVLYCTNCD